MNEILAVLHAVYLSCNNQKISLAVDNQKNLMSGIKYKAQVALHVVNTSVSHLFSNYQPLDLFVLAHKLASSFLTVLLPLITVISHMCMQIQADGVFCYT